MTSTVTLNPSGGELLHTQEDAIGASATITASGVDLPIVQWDYQFTPSNNNFSVTTDGTSLTVEYMSADGLFPFTVGYLDPNMNFHLVEEWGDLPAIDGSPDIVELNATLTNTVVFGLEVTATDSLAETVSGSYTIVIEANYSLNRDILVEQLGDREDG